MSVTDFDASAEEMAAWSTDQLAQRMAYITRKIHTMVEGEEMTQAEERMGIALEAHQTAWSVAYLQSLKDNPDRSWTPTAHKAQADAVASAEFLERQMAEAEVHRLSKRLSGLQSMLSALRGLHYHASQMERA